MMLKTHLALMDELKDYASPRAKLTRMLKSGSIVQLRRGLFVDDVSISPRVVAPVLYGPSYISFEYVLATAGLIPERVAAVTSATFNKNKDKVFRTPIGEFVYRYLPAAVYPHGIKHEIEEGAGYLIATPEKALCDSIYKVKGLNSPRDVVNLLFDDWRIQQSDLANLDRAFISWIAPMYGRRSVAHLVKALETGDWR